MITDELNESIRVSVETEYLDEQSVPEDKRFVFAYHIAINNKGEQAATLRTRHWFITDGNNEMQEVKGDGVVGEQPTIEPGETYRYSSGSVLATEVGSMRGYYVMEADDGTLFHATVPVFTLAIPSALN
ncbi:MAG: Co2+/Mg2+ efflux protein ApaG [Oceanospirillaceae bacterium]|uniref:Co2+/Mg2+ efflux protein ApaG n=1 Tax=unclassified Thalassolituus TaxID=2624967 RepID=UPI000C0BABFE|nr:MULTISPECIES: Co2+/Mg2+ efflux protein ApaG [unclassified Thalassolituus]MAK91527.1 Co2+/Mg2+ efflux protein ApaG [Thalassolituus sp.]MAS24551.1 Co2+/Mg2+ efflux protein ApaG [Oceanospirillaceae bacterium]MBS52603.1 Co2+/Mg2+ efflux protein ApaG [Oceanospirillaceae bacterium]|tara:strand:- start:410 stop:796 length:387 start_codon:yes stop_codon:yes gene_type:complete